jgi:predicted RNase H-like nuclease (RuvC/YqgF family)
MSEQPTESGPLDMGAWAHEVKRLRGLLTECRHGRASQKSKRIVAQRSARANAEGRRVAEAEVERLRDEMEELRRSDDEAWLEVERLRAALERIASIKAVAWLGNQPDPAVIAREALNPSTAPVNTSEDA